MTAKIKLYILYTQHLIIFYRWYVLATSCCHSLMHVNVLTVIFPFRSPTGSHVEWCKQLIAATLNSQHSAGVPPEVPSRDLKASLLKASLTLAHIPIVLNQANLQAYVKPSKYTGQQTKEILNPIRLHYMVSSSVAKTTYGQCI